MTKPNHFLAGFTSEDTYVILECGRDRSERHPGLSRAAYVQASIGDNARAALAYYRSPEGAAAGARRRIAVWVDADPDMPGPDHPDAVY